MIACWHEEKNISGIIEFLTEKGIQFETGESFMRGHTAFLVENGKRNIVANMIAKKFGRFEREYREIEITPEEQKIIDAKNASLMEKERLYKEKNARLKRLFESVDNEENENEEGEVE